MGQAKNRGSLEQRQQTAAPKQPSTKEPANLGKLSMKQATSLLLRAGRSAKRR